MPVSWVGSCALPANADARINPLVRQVGQGVAGKDKDRAKEHNAKQQGDVAA
jgi:hypothetical protein